MLPFICDNFNAGIGNFSEWVIDSANPKLPSDDLLKTVNLCLFQRNQKSEMAYNIKAGLYNIATTLSIISFATSFFNPSALISFGMCLGTAYLIHEAMLRTFYGMQMHIENNKYAPFKPFITESGLAPQKHFVNF